MSKRFTDSRKWEDEWFLLLDTKYQLFWIYLLDKSDHCGIYKPALSIARFCMHQDFDEIDVIEKLKDRIVVLPNGRWFIPKFLNFQYGKFSTASNLHLKIIKDLKITLPKDVYKAYVTPLIDDVTPESLSRQGGDTLKDKDKETIPPTNNKNGYATNLPKIDEFENFWKLYPKKVGKPVACAKWKKINPSPDLIAKIANALMLQRHSTQWTRDDGQYIPHPSTWLNQERWNDQLDMPRERHPEPKAEPFDVPWSVCPECGGTLKNFHCTKCGEDFAQPISPEVSLSKI